MLNVLKNVFKNLFLFQDDFELKLLLKSLELKEPQFDIIFITKNRTISKSHLKKYLNKKNGKIVSTLPKIYYTDYCSSIFSYIVCFTLKVQYFIQVSKYF